MSKIELRNGKVVGDYCKPYIIAEMNSSHFGKIDIAKSMISKAKEIGCDCVKFQSWSAETLYSKNYYDENPIAKRIVKKFSLNEDNLIELSSYSKEIGIDFASTPYSKKEVDFLIDECKVPFVKIASMDITNYPYLKYIAEKNIPIILSTGMSTYEEIELAINAIENTGNKKIYVLHCVSNYPAEAEDIRLQNIVRMKELFGDFPIGYSDHTIGSEIASASIALGVGLVEKHFTLDNKKMGMDNNMATEPAEFKSLVESCHKVFMALGGYERIISKKEQKQRDMMRRSIVASRKLSIGDIISGSDLDYKRPASGMEPKFNELIIGKRVIRDIEKDQMINREDFE